MSTVVTTETVDRIVYYGAESIKAKLMCRYDASMGEGVLQVCPRGVAEWAEFLERSGLSILHVDQPAVFDGALVLTQREHWLALISRNTPLETAPQILCNIYCEYLMADCSMLGRNAEEVFPVPISYIRRRLSCLVSAELC